MTATHVRTRFLPSLVCLLLGCLPLLIPWSAGAATPEVLRAVHTDVLHSTYDGTSLKLATRIGTGDYRDADPAGLVFNLEDRGSARVELPDVPAFAFLGKPGDPVWIAPESQDPELIWPGWDTETIPAGALRDDVVDLTLVDAEGPGAVEVFFNYDEFTGVVPRLFSSVDPAYKTVDQPVGRHVHANWSFSALGTYRLTFQASATTVTGTAVTSGPVVYTFVVGLYEPPTSPPPTTPPTSPPTTLPPTTPPPTSPPTTPPTTPPSTSPSVTPSTTPPACVTAVLSVGHVDVAARTVGSRLRFQVKDGTRGATVWRDPGTVAFQVKPSADEVVPASAAYRFLGPAGATVWQIPQTQAADLLWSGWNTESVDYTTLNGPVRWSLDKVSGPGKAAVYQFDQFGQPLISFDSGTRLPQSISLAGPTHAHGNWAFTKLGLYKLTFTHSATTKSGQKLSDTATLSVVVGNDLSSLCHGGPAPTTQPTSAPTDPPATSPAPISRPSRQQPTTGPSDARTTAASSHTPAATSTLRPCITTPSPSTTPATSTTTATTSSTPAPTAGTTLTSGHADYAVRLEGGSLTSRLKDGTHAGTPVWRDPASVTVRLTSAAATTAPGGAFAFLGAAGTPIWQIPQTQKSGVVWLGWNTEELTAAQVHGGVDWRLDKLTGPGALAVFEFDSFGQPKVIFNSADGLPDIYRVPLGTHAHGNWAFTKPGTYHATFTHTGTLANGKKSTDTATLTFSVGSSGGARSISADASGPAAASSPSVSDSAQSVSGCKLAITGGSIGLGWIVAAAVVLVLGVVLVAATRRGAR
ncbi:TIGR03773 family transporter-associated surface protein [Kribbella sp. NPDC026596]|uniref:TIGR03773 family transporter-associated surface protein n=1 Tax=Kribbella sp. NPDC026596 TaxID=3155122 RepID=UPI0034109249